MFTEEGQYPVSAYGLEAIMTCGFSRKQFEKLVWQHSQDDFQKLVKRVRHAGAVVVGGYSPYGMVSLPRHFWGGCFPFDTQTVSAGTNWLQRLPLMTSRRPEKDV